MIRTQPISLLKLFLLYFMVTVRPWDTWFGFQEKDVLIKNCATWVTFSLSIHLDEIGLVACLINSCKFLIFVIEMPLYTRTFTLSKRGSCSSSLCVLRPCCIYLKNSGLPDIWRCSWLSVKTLTNISLCACPSGLFTKQIYLPACINCAGGPISNVVLWIPPESFISVVGSRI